MITAAGATEQAAPEVSSSPLRVVTAASLFDGHDAAINVMRRLIQDHGVEVIHLGHNRSVADVVRAAIQEDADAIALSSYQGGHIEYFKYAVDMLREHGAGHISVFGGGGGTITPMEIAELQEYGVARIYHPNDGMTLGLTGMIDELVALAHERRLPAPSEGFRPGSPASPTTWPSRRRSRRSRTSCSTRQRSRSFERSGQARTNVPPSLESPAPVGRERAPSPTSC